MADTLNVRSYVLAAFLLLTFLVGGFVGSWATSQQQRFSHESYICILDVLFEKDFDARFQRYDAEALDHCGVSLSEAERILDINE